MLANSGLEDAKTFRKAQTIGREKKVENSKFCY